MGNLINKLLCMPENEGSSKNMAFVFIKPHAVTEATKKLVAEVLAAKGLTILEQGELTAEEIDKKRLIDQHYYAIASKATILKPAQLNVPADKFKAKFGDDWQVQLDAGKVLNASDACAKYGLSAEELGKVWDVASAKKLLVKFGGGFYCAKLTFGTKKKETAYVFNGFFMRMRNKFTAPGKRIHYYVVSWEAEKLSWKDFRGKLLGPTDPAKAPSGSLRAEIYSRWQELGLSRAHDVGDNGVHASASPFEGLCERMNWLATPTAKDPYGMYLLDKGITEATISAWSYDPQVLYLDGGQGSVWDVLEDLDSEPLCEKALALAQANSALPIP